MLETKEYIDHEAPATAPLDDFIRVCQSNRDGLQKRVTELSSTVDALRADYCCVDAALENLVRARDLLAGGRLDTFPEIGPAALNPAPSPEISAADCCLPPEVDPDAAPADLANVDAISEALAGTPATCIEIVRGPDGRITSECWKEIDAAMRPLFESGTSIRDLSEQFHIRTDSISERARRLGWKRSGAQPANQEPKALPPKPEMPAANFKGVLARFGKFDSLDRQKFNFGMRCYHRGADEEAADALGCSPGYLSYFIQEHTARLSRLLKCVSNSEVAAFLAEWHNELEAKRDA